MHITINFIKTHHHDYYPGDVSSDNRNITEDKYRIVVPIDDIIMEDSERTVTFRNIIDEFENSENRSNLTRPVKSPITEHEYRIIVKNFSSTRNFGEVMSNGNYVFKVDQFEYERVFNLIHRHNEIQAKGENRDIEDGEIREKWSVNEVNGLMGIELE